jgi:hypothetical protein
VIARSGRSPTAVLLYDRGPGARISEMPVRKRRQGITRSAGRALLFARSAQARSPADVSNWPSKR